MKKLLSLLSVLTISGTAVPTVIASSPYQKEETNLENNNINKEKVDKQIISLTENDLENLIRNKRELNEWEIFGITLAGTVIGGILTGGIGFAIGGLAGGTSFGVATGAFAATSMGMPLGAEAAETIARNN